jgi:phosphoribosylglycinamide formyltransferase-1
VLLSGRGSNFLAIHQAIAAGALPARIVAVVSDQPEAAGLARARELGLPAHAVPRRGPSGTLGREEHEARVLAVLDEAAAEWVCLAGYMRLLSAGFVARYRHRLVNIHPSLLPAFPGLDAQEQAIEHGVRVSGCTVHLVDEGLDSGPIVVQRSVPVLDGDTSDSLAARILTEEHRAYVAALERLLTEEWVVEGRRLLFGGGAGTTGAPEAPNAPGPPGRAPRE